MVHRKLFFSQQTMKAVLRTNGQYDRCQTAIYLNATRFPVVQKQTNNVGIATFIYSSNVPNLKEFGSSKIAQYIEIAPRSNCSFHIDATLQSDNNTWSAVLSAITLTNPNPNSYFTTTFDGNLSGASLGLAATLAIIGAPPVICTGFVNCFGISFDSDEVHAIDHVEQKADVLRERGELLMLPEKNIEHTHLHGSDKLTRAYKNGGVYTFEHFLKGLNPWYGQFFAIAVSNVAEALLIAQTYPKQ